MFYNEKQATDACKEDPLLIFDFIDAGYKKLVNKLLNSNIVDVNLKDKDNNDVISNMLIRNWYVLVLKYMKKNKWMINSQNNEGNTFAHILVTKNYLDVLPIITELKKNKKFVPNIRNKYGETILDKSIHENYIMTTVKILEDERFNNIDLVSFKHLYENYIKNNNYGVYSKLNNLEIIVDNLLDKKLRTNMKNLLTLIVNNLEIIKEEVSNNRLNLLDSLVNNYIEGLIS